MKWKSRELHSITDIKSIVDIFRYLLDLALWLKALNSWLKTLFLSARLLKTFLFRHLWRRLQNQNMCAWRTWFWVSSRWENIKQNVAVKNYMPGNEIFLRKELFEIWSGVSGQNLMTIWGKVKRLMALANKQDGNTKTKKSWNAKHSLVNIFGMTIQSK